MNRFARCLVVPLVTLVACLGLFPGAGQAHVSGCRTDPLVTLTNLTQITLHEEIRDTSTDVTGIHYERHVPKGVKVLRVVYYGAVPAKLQSLTTFADEAPGVYDDYTTVNTGASQIPVTAYMS